MVASVIASPNHLMAVNHCNDCINSSHALSPAMLSKFVVINICS